MQRDGAVKWMSVYKLVGTESSVEEYFRGNQDRELVDGRYWLAGSAAGAVGEVKDLFAAGYKEAWVVHVSMRVPPCGVSIVGAGADGTEAKDASAVPTQDGEGGRRVERGRSGGGVGRTGEERRSGGEERLVVRAREVHHGGVAQDGRGRRVGAV